MQAFPAGMKDPVGRARNAGQRGGRKPQVQIPVKLTVLNRERALDPQQAIAHNHDIGKLQSLPFLPEFQLHSAQ